MLKVTFFSLQYMGSFPVAIPDIASRAEYVRSQLETLRVSTFSDKNFLKVFCDSFREINLDVYIYMYVHFENEILENYYYYYYFASRMKFKVCTYQ